MNYIRTLILPVLLLISAQATSFENFPDFVHNLTKPVESKAFWMLQTTVFTQHFHPKDHHNNNQQLLGFERNREDSYIWGAATFLNSFDQRSYIAYAGKRFDFGNTPFFSRLVGGAIYGYKGEYKNKVPLNHLGVGPVILPSVGARFKNVQTEAVLLGLNAYMITLGVRL